MTPDQLMDPLELKKSIREQAHANGKRSPKKDALSQTICETVRRLARIRRRRDGDVLRRRPHRGPHAALPARPARLAASGSSCPIASTGELELFLLENMDELAIGMYKILEPKAELRELAEKRVDVKELDLIMVPGVAFDAAGRAWARLRLLRQAAGARPGRCAAGGFGLRVPAFSRRFRRRRTTSSWTRSSPKQAIYPGKGR